jgi:pyrimidine-nucleoside phosphorylase
VRLAARMLVLADIAADDVEAERRVRQALSSGKGVEKFRDIIAQQGGDPLVIDDYSLLPRAASRAELRATRTGFVSTLVAGAIGRAAVSLGAGRDRVDSVIDPAVGLEVVAPVGTPVSSGDVVLVVHYNTPAQLDAARGLAQGAIVIAESPPVAAPLVSETMDVRSVTL